jgi:hypothetical protein
MHHAQQLRHPLDFVHDNGPVPGGSFGDLSQALRASLQLPVNFGFQQVYENGIRQLMAQPGGLPGAPKAEKKKTFLWQAEKSTSELHFAPHFGIIVSIISRPDGVSQLKVLLQDLAQARALEVGRNMMIAWIGSNRAKRRAVYLLFDSIL